MASSPQPRNRLEKGESKNDIVPTYMWKKKAGGERKGSKENKNEKVLRELVPKKFWK